MRSALLIAAVLLFATSARADIAWRANLKSAHQEATTSGKPILVHFYSDNCVWCDRLEQGVFRDPAVTAAIAAQFIPVKINGTREPKFANAFSVSRYPTDVIVASDGSVLAHQLSPQDTSRYLAMLNAPEVSGRIARGATSAPAAAMATATPTAAMPGPLPSGTSLASESPAAAAAGGLIAAPAATKPNRQVAGPGPEMAGFAMPPGIATGNFDMRSFAATPAIAAGHRQPGMAGALGLAPPANTTAPATASGPATPSGPANLAPTADDAPTASNPTQPLPPEAMDGYCPVTMITETRWAQGRPEYGVIHFGQLYLFASAEAQRKFLASPEPYTPVLNGIDVVKFFDEHKVVPGSREWGYTDPVYGRMFFFADEASMNHFYDHHQRYVEPAIELSQRAAADVNRRR